MKSAAPGTRFGKLVVVSRDGVHAAVTCDCGNTKSVFAGNLLRGRTSSCGCEWRRGKHGMSGTPEYHAWAAMMERCGNPRIRSYKRYGARGITVCKSWRDAFEAFLADMGLRPSPEHSIDRINNDGNYEPGNCRWATRVEQANNKSPRRYVRLNGVDLGLRAASAAAGLPNSCVVARVKRLGWSPAFALMWPPGPTARRQP